MAAKRPRGYHFRQLSPFREENLILSPENTIDRGESTYRWKLRYYCPAHDVVSDSGFGETKELGRVIVCIHASDDNAGDVKGSLYSYERIAENCDLRGPICPRQNVVH